MAKIVEDFIVIRVAKLVPNNSDLTSLVTEEVRQTIATVAAELIEAADPKAMVELDQPDAE